ncbi:uncharacterized protein LOC144914729 isoform X2 [Branchiostoma floridae x Branchiostoma belcheri]
MKFITFITVVEYCQLDGSLSLMLLLAPRGHTQMMVLQRSEDTVPTGVGILEGINNGQLYLEAVQRDRQRILESRCLRQEQDAEIWQQLGRDRDASSPCLHQARRSTSCRDTSSPCLHQVGSFRNMYIIRNFIPFF